MTRPCRDRAASFCSGFLAMWCLIAVLESRHPATVAVGVFFATANGFIALANWRDDK